MKKWFVVLMVVLCSILCSSTAQAAEPYANVSLGVSGLYVMNTQRYAAALRVDLKSRADNGITLGLSDEAMVMLPLGGFDKIPSLHNKTAFTFGYASENVLASVGGALSQYWMSVCSPKLCSRTGGIAPSAEVSISVYQSWLLGGAGGFTATASVGLYDGSSAVLTKTPIVYFFAGPAYRWGYGVK